VPEGGFVPYQGALVSKDEREKRVQGMVRYKGIWVTPEDKEKLASGYVKYQGKWVTPDEKDLLAQGYVKYQEKWYTKEELSELRKSWEHAWTFHSDHYFIRSNISEEFSDELGRFMEAAFQEYAKFFGTTNPRGMTLYAFRSYEDYRGYCLSTDNSSHLRAGGFATNQGNIAVGWMRDDEHHLLFTMIHEGAHLFHYNAYPSQSGVSWFNEAIATQFEGFAWDGKTLKVHFISAERLGWLKRAFSSNQYMSLSDMLAGNALELINQNPGMAATFYAQCWGLYYFLTQTPKYQKRFASYVQKMNDGDFRGKELDSFREEFGAELNEMETTWHNYIIAME
jgi:hypothetical protein